MIKNISLRAQMTIITTIILIVVATVLTITSVFNANHSLVNPIYSMISIEMLEGGPVVIQPMMPDAAPIEGAEGLIINLDGPSAPSVLGENPEMISDVAFDTQIIVSGVKAFKSSAIGYMLVIILVGTIIVYYVLGRVLNPVKKLSDEMELINEKRLSERLVGFDTSQELKELSHSFNMMLDRLDRAFESQKRFSSDAAHELKTPLTVLKTRLDVLALDSHIEEEDYIQFMSVVKKQTDRMIQLVDNLFILSAQQDYELEDEIFIDTIFVDILDDLRGQIESKNLSVTYRPCGVRLHSNQIMITHAFSNLVQNAIKYNHQDGIVEIKTEVMATNCIIEVIDTGIGIPFEKAEYIFDAFYCVDPSRSRRFGGAGLGLAITKDVISRHEGTLEYAPNPSGGSIFKVTLPIK